MRTMLIERNLESRLSALSKRFPVVTVTGPRQSGKTTLCGMAFPDLPHLSLEAPDLQEYARRDPRGLLREHNDGVVLDEVQRVPELLSYIQVDVDENPGMGRYILTGSANFGLLNEISQSLAGRTALLNLLPMSLDELRRFPDAPGNLNTLLVAGSYPAVFDRAIDPHDWYSSYVGTYLERDVKQISNVGNTIAFQTFIRLAAGRSASLVNLSALGADAGVSHNTAKSWLAVLETGFLIMRLPPFFANVRKRLVKTPKLHFVDSGLLCYLLGIRSAEQLAHHPLRGSIFESWVVSEIIKARVHQGLPPDLFFYRDRRGTEIDAVLQRDASLMAVEVKSGQTIAADFFSGLEQFERIMCEDPLGRSVEAAVVYAGDQVQKRTGADVIPWSKVPEYEWS